jgi:DNA-damage-inducible protein D
MTQLTLLSGGAEEASPFDQIRRVRDDGTEYWSARELMPLLGYETWQRFAETVERARVSMTITHPSIVDAAFKQVTQLSDAANLGQRERQDFELSRFACYLTAMRGDERKPEVAAALAYFAIKTHEAEVRPQLTLQEQALLLASQLLKTANSLAMIEHQRELDAPKVEAYDEFLNTEGCLTVEEFGKTRGMPGPRLIWGVLVGIAFLRSDNQLPMQNHINAKRAFVDSHGTTQITHKGQMWLRAQIIAPRGGRQDRL